MADDVKDTQAGRPHPDVGDSVLGPAGPQAPGAGIGPGGPDSPPIRSATNPDALIEAAVHQIADSSPTESLGQVATLWFFEGRDQDEIAARLGVSSTEVDDALSEVRAHLMRELVTPGGLVQQEHIEASVARFERHYQRIGWWKGPWATEEARLAERAYWRDVAGEWGIRWLVRRLRSESHPDLLDGVANLLADLGRDSLVPIFEELRDHPVRDQAEALLKAVGWIASGHRVSGTRAEPWSALLSDFLDHQDPDLREAACRAFRLLPRRMAVCQLSQRERVETNPDVRLTIEEEVAEPGSGRA